MKLFQQLLVAPAALGLLAPLSANAAEVNIKGITDYAGFETYEEEVSTAQLSDVVPGDWAYTALLNLSESYGCVDNAYTHNLKSGQALTRYEAASLVNACLDGGIASADIDTSDAARLTSEFGTEMAILKGRVDGLEYKVQELSAGQFSSATKMSGQAVFTTGWVDTDANNQTGKNDNRLTSQYTYGIDLNTSFTGEDLLTIGIEASNTTANNSLDSSFANTAGNNVLEVSSMFYSFPMGDDWQLTGGPLLDQDDVISATTSVYSDAFRLGSMPWGTSGETGPGAAIAYANDAGYNASLSLVTPLGSGATFGILTNESNDIITGSFGYDDDNWGAGVIYKSPDVNQDASFAVGVYFTPEDFPTISVAYDSLNATTVANSSNLLIGLDYPVGPGTASAAYQSVDTSGTTTSNYELYYNYPVTDGIEIQGGVFVEGQAAATVNDTVGYMVETFFKF